MRRQRGELPRRESDSIYDAPGIEVDKLQARRNESARFPSGIRVVTGIIGAVTVAFKLHKHAILGGAWISAGAIAVVAEDMTVFLALFLLWRWGYQAILRTVARDIWPAYRGASRRVVARCAAVLHALAFYSLALFMLVFVAVEHMYFWSTGSLLDGDALLVARKSLGPILFIAINVEGGRFLAWGLFAAFAAATAVAISRASSTCSRHESKESRAATRTRARRRKQICTNRKCNWHKATALLAKSLRVAAVLSSAPVLAAAYAACVFVACLVFGLGQQDGNHRLKLLRRNCFVRVALDLTNMPPPLWGERWTSAALEAWSERVVGGIDERVASAITIAGSSEPASDKDREARFRGGDLKEHVGATGRPNVVIVVLESTSGSLVTPSNDAGVSPWAAKLAQRGLSSTSFYSSMPNTNKAMFQIMCGMTPSLETSWVEFEQPALLEAVCLPGLLRSKLGYESLFLTASMVGGLGCLGFDEAIGFAGEEEQGGREGFRSRGVHDKFSFGHGTFEKVNYLGYDDHVVLNRSLSFLLGNTLNTLNTRGGSDTAGGKLLTILTVGPHHFHDVPTDFPSDDIAPWTKASAINPGRSATVSSLQDKYLAALRYQDLFLERLYAQLDGTGLSENTYVVVVGDHGEAFDEHGYNKHGNNVYQEGIKVPFFVTGPEWSRVPRGGTSDRVGMHADIAPTVLDLLGLWRPVPRGGEGDSASEVKPLSGSTPALAATLGPNDRTDQSLPRKDLLSPAKRYTLRGRDLAQRLLPIIDGEHRTAVAEGSRPGSGLLGDSLLGPDERGCAVAGVHYGDKTLAVVAGRWKGVFLYRWDGAEDGSAARARIVNAELFELVADPQERDDLLGDGVGGCCPTDQPDVPISSTRDRSPLSTSCHAAAQNIILENATWHREPTLDAPVREVCCHLQSAAVEFARSNLRFYGRQPRPSIAWR